MKDNLPIIIILVIIAVALFGGNKKDFLNPNNFFVQTPQQKIQSSQARIDTLQKQLNQINEDKDASRYKKDITLQYGSVGTKANQEYIVIKVNPLATEKINITGWKLRSTQTNIGVDIGKGVDLYFSNTTNGENDIVLSPNDTAYIVTGISPVGYSFRVNKCSGYLEQFQDFSPYLSTNCPLPQNENLSVIPKLRINDDCFDRIRSFPQCTIQRDPLPENWSSECKTFITEKINYGSCINTHKGDTDFLSSEWRVYLKRSDTLWKTTKEEILLYDTENKIVGKLSY